MSLKKEHRIMLCINFVRYCNASARYADWISSLPRRPLSCVQVTDPLLHALNFDPRTYLENLPCLSKTRIRTADYIHHLFTDAGTVATISGTENLI